MGTAQSIQSPCRAEALPSSSEALEGSVPQVSGVAHNEIYNAGRCG